MNLIVWNSQGAKWDACWQHFIYPAIGADPEGVIALLVESGWAPWVASGDVTINGEYWLESGATWYDERKALNSAFCNGVTNARRNKAIWVPWVKNLDALKTNSRCSMGGAMLPNSFTIGQTDRFRVDGFLRPVIRVTLGKQVQKGPVTPKFTILLVHMISGYQGRAQQQLEDLTSQVSRLIPEGTPAIIVGDMNVDLLKQQKRRLTLPEGWWFLRTGVATQQSGGELDYGLLFDQRDQISATASVVEQYKGPNNDSDHSVISYDIPLSELG